MKRQRIGTGIAALAVLVLVVVGCSLLNSSTPTATYKAFADATKKHDAAAIKKTLSKASLAMMEKSATEQKKSLDDLLTEKKPGEDATGAPQETRNEKITGDTATLEIKREKTDEWDTLPFVKEDGEWKIAMDKFIDDLMNKVKEQTTKP